VEKIPRSFSLLECFRFMNLKVAETRELTRSHAILFGLEAPTSLGYGFLQPYLDDPAVEEIWVNQPGEVFLAKRGEVARIETPFTADELMGQVERMLRSAGRRLDRTRPFVDASLPDGTRLHVVIPEITRDFPSLNLRKFQLNRPNLQHLLELGTLNREQATFLQTKIRSGATCLISGATQAGKTTFLSALLAELPVNERVVSVEDTFELSLPNPDWVAMQTRPKSAEGVGEVDLRRLIREVLRMRPSRIVVGEVRGAEALDLLIALNAGLPGLCTLHANSASQAIDKLRTLPLLAGENISTKFLDPTIANSIDLVVHCERLATGQRRVAQIGEVRLEAGELRVVDAA
jgi:pilus assembly protein CpaF